MHLTKRILTLKENTVLVWGFNKEPNTRATFAKFLSFWSKLNIPAIL